MIVFQFLVARGCLKPEIHLPLDSSTIVSYLCFVDNCRASCNVSAAFLIAEDRGRTIRPPGVW
jgi:hypothetical protein